LQDLKRIVEIVKEIQSTNSKDKKVRIISENSDNELLREVLTFLLDNGMITGISKKKINKKLELEPSEIFLTLEEVFNYLLAYSTGRDIDICNVMTFINSYHEEETQEFLKQLITKTLKLGCDVKTVNKAIPKLIFEWEVQQAYPIDKYKFKEDEWFSLSVKQNGNRGSFLDGVIKSRQNKEFSGLSHIIEDLEKLHISDLFVDGELIRKNVDNVSDGENFRIGTGILNSDDEDKTLIEFVIFDVMTKDDFVNGESSGTYRERVRYLEELRWLIEDQNVQNVKIIDVLYSGTDLSQVDILLEKMVKEDKEGLMLNRDTTYKCKRHNGILKVKRFYTMDLEIVDIQEGDGRLKETLGALVVKYKDNIVNVGSGFDDEARDKFWNDRDNLIGKIIEVKYKEITKDKKTGLESLQFPVFIQMRENKTEESYN